MSSEKSVVLATAGYDHKIKFWEAPTGLCQRTIEYKESQVNCLEITPDKQFLAVAGNPHVRLYDVNSSSSRPVYNFEGHTGNVTVVGFQKDLKWMYTGSEDGSVKIWDIRTPGYQRDYKEDVGITCLALHPNQGEIISGDENGAIRVLDLTTESCSNRLIPDGKLAIRSVSVASDASLFVASNNRGTCFVWKLGKGFTPCKQVPAHTTYCLKAILSPDVKCLATTSADKSVKIWNVAKGFELDKTLHGHGAWVWDCSFSADSAYLVTASSDKTANLWDVKSGKVILSYKGHHKALTSVALNDSSS